MSVIKQIPNPPTDAISSVRFSPDDNSLLVGSWDSAVHIYQRGDEGFTHHKTIQCDAPILDVCWGADASTFFAVGIDQDVVKYSVHEGEDSRTVMSSHDQAANKVAYSKEHDIVISTSWDCTIHVHNPNNNAYVPVKLIAKPFAMTITSDRLVVAMSERNLHVYDLSALKDLISQAGSTEGMREPLTVEPWQQRISNLKNMTRSIASMPDGTGFSSGSIEGRVAVEYLDPAREKEAYAFKCHRVRTPGKNDKGEDCEWEIVHPVNALAYHPVHGTFATAGGDGGVALWDAKTKRRIRQYVKLEASIAAIDFSHDGKNLAIGVSPGFEEGKEEEEADTNLIKLYVRELTDTEAKPVKAKPPKEK